MKKITISAILALTITIEADSWYIGLEQSLINSIDNDTEVCGRNYSNDESSNITSIKIGTIMGSSNKDTRVELVYNSGEKSANPTGGLTGSSLTSYSANFNITTPSLSPKEELVPYFRIGTSYVVSDDKYYVRGTNEKESYSATRLVLGIGGYYYLTDNFTISTGFDYGYGVWRELSSGWCKIESTDKIKKLYIGAEYLF